MPRCLRIEDVADDAGQAGLLGELGGITHQGPDLMALFEGLGQDLPTGPAGGAEERDWQSNRT
jgi:hypothetical protein